MSALVPIRVLLVENDLTWAKSFVRDSLKPAGLEAGYDFDVTIVGRMDVANVALGIGHKYDVVLVDLSLPDSGPEATQAVLREKSEAWDVPIIVVTGSLEEKMDVECVRMGADAFIHKGDIPKARMLAVQKIAASHARRLNVKG